MADFKKLRKKLHLTPDRALVVSYLAAIILGTFLLSLPAASRQVPLSWLDALFTATSAQCVTGLIVVDTGQQFTLFGQLVILLLIQIGGLGITTFSVYLFFCLRMGIGTRGRWLIQETLLHTPVASLKTLIFEIIAITLIIEALGTFFLAFVFVPEAGFLQGIYIALFHAVSAFCNAGFSLFPDSLIAYRGHAFLNITIMVLIVLGGIGFLVIRELIDMLRTRKRKRLSLHSRLVLITTAILIGGGALVIGLLENSSSLAGMSFQEKILVSFFQSITTRTAGFNSIDLSLFEAPTLVFMIFLMFIGASPGSSGGGVKTTSLALAVAILKSRLKGTAHTNIFHRTIPVELVLKTLTLVLSAVLFLGATTFILLCVQNINIPVARSPNSFLMDTFEAVSAFSTVGLSLGITAKLSIAGKFLVIILMFVGRVGLLTAGFAILKRAEKIPTRYSEENIMIG